MKTNFSKLSVTGIIFFAGISPLIAQAQSGGTFTPYAPVGAKTTCLSKNTAASIINELRFDCQGLGTFTAQELQNSGWVFENIQTKPTNDPVFAVRNFKWFKMEIRRAK